MPFLFVSSNKQVERRLFSIITMICISNEKETIGGWDLLPYQLC